MNMTARFYALLIGIVLLLMAWNYTHYQQELLEQAQLKDLASYPIYAYISDTTKVSVLRQQLKAVAEIDSLRHDTGENAGLELVQSYSLPIGEDMLAGFRFPDVLTIYLRGNNAARLAKPKVISMLRRELPEVDIDGQSIVWTKTENQFKAMQRNKIIITALLAIMLLFAFIYARIAMALRILVMQKRKLVSVVDVLRFKAESTKHSLLLLFIPPLVSAALYFIPVYYGWVSIWGKDFLLPWWLFATQGGVLLLGTIVVAISSHLMDRDNRLHRDEIHVETTYRTPAPNPEPEDVL